MARIPKTKRKSRSEEKNSPNIKLDKIHDELKKISKALEPKPQEKPIPPFTFERELYIRFVFSTLIVWLFFIIVSFSFQGELIFSTETVREMTGDSIALAGIPFAILSVLAVLGRDHDNYLKIALASIASVFFGNCVWLFLGIMDIRRFQSCYKTILLNRNAFRIHRRFCCSRFMGYSFKYCSSWRIIPRYTDNIFQENISRCCLFYDFFSCSSDFRKPGRAI